MKNLIKKCCVHLLDAEARGLNLHFEKKRNREKELQKPAHAAPKGG
jgi:hypothetical protein